MKKPKFEQVEFILPEWSLPYFINGDCSGYEDDELTEMQSFAHEVAKRYGNAFFSVVDELGFLHSNDLNKLGADCVRCIILIPA